VGEKQLECSNMESRLKDLKAQKNNANDFVDDQLVKIVRQDDSHRTKLELYMKLLNDETDSYKEFVML